MVPLRVPLRVPMRGNGSIIGVMPYGFLGYNAGFGVFGFWV